jgi:hypothetical protein
MIGTGVRHLKGSIAPKLSENMLREFHRQWELQPGTDRAKLKKMDGETFEIEYDNWDNVTHIFELTVGKAVNLLDLKSPCRKVTFF